MNVIGVNYSLLGKIIQVNNLNTGSIDRDKDKLLESIKAIESSYQGNSVSDIFTTVTSQEESIKEIPEIIGNYSSVLTSVIDANKKKDNKVIEYVEHVTNKVNTR